MIPLKIPNKLIELKKCKTQEQYLQCIATEHLQYIKSNMTINYKKIDCWIKNHFNDVNGKSYNFEGIILAPISELRTIKSWIDLQGKSFGKETKKDKNGKIKMVYKKELKSLVNWYQDKIQKAKFIEQLGITVCPYCNRSYINVAQISEKKRATSQIEHFIPKGEYPIFALSFFNLMPVCTNCNSLKAENEICTSIYDIKSHYEKLVFSFIPLDVDFLSDKDKIRILLKGSDDMNSNIKHLGLESLYQIHNDYVQEILKKKEIYSQIKIDEIYNDFPNLFANKEEIYRLAFGNYMEDVEVHKRPLAKLTIDICKELKIL